MPRPIIPVRAHKHRLRALGPTRHLQRVPAEIGQQPQRVVPRPAVARRIRQIRRIAVVEGLRRLVDGQAGLLPGERGRGDDADVCAELQRGRELGDAEVLGVCGARGADGAGPDEVVGCVQEEDGAVDGLEGGVCELRLVGVWVPGAAAACRDLLGGRVGFGAWVERAQTLEHVRALVVERVDVLVRRRVVHVPPAPDRSSAPSTQAGWLVPLTCR